MNKQTQLKMRVYVKVNKKNNQTHRSAQYIFDRKRSQSNPSKGMINCQNGKNQEDFKNTEERKQRLI